VQCLFSRYARGLEETTDGRILTTTLPGPQKNSPVGQIMHPPLVLPPLDHDSQLLAPLPVSLQATLHAARYSEVSLRKLLGRDPHPDQSPLIEPRSRCQSPPSKFKKKGRQR
jgi:hypothetical protein